MFIRGQSPSGGACDGLYCPFLEIGMIKRIFEAVAGLCQAATYLLTLFTSLVIMALVAGIVLGLAVRMGQFLWVALFAEKWL